MTETNPANRRLGYARVSTYGQTLDAQLEQLRAEGCTAVYREKASGAQPDRRELLKMLAGLRSGDIVTVTRIDADKFYWNGKYGEGHRYFGDAGIEPYGDEYNRCNHKDSNCDHE